MTTARLKPSLDRDHIMALAHLQFIERAEAVHFLNPPGTGKSQLPSPLPCRPHPRARPSQRTHHPTTANQATETTTKK